MTHAIIPGPREGECHRDAVTVIMPTIPPRRAQRGNALHSVAAQNRLPSAVLIEEDTEKLGSARMRNRMLRYVTTEWVTFLDDDDMLYPQHLSTLMAAQHDTGADVVYGWYDVHGGTDPRPDREGKPFDADELRRGSYITVPSLVRTSLARAAGFEYRDGLDDWGFYLNLLDLGAMFHHVPERLFLWNHWAANTSGSPERW